MGVHSVLCSWCPSVCGKDKLLGHTASVMSFDNELQLEKIVDRLCKPEHTSIIPALGRLEQKCQHPKPGSRKTGTQNKQEAPITDVSCTMEVLVQVTDPACYGLCEQTAAALCWV